MSPFLPQGAKILQGKLMPQAAAGWLWAEPEVRRLAQRDLPAASSLVKEGGVLRNWPLAGELSDMLDMSPL